MIADKLALEESIIFYYLKVSRASGCDLPHFHIAWLTENINKAKHGCYCSVVCNRNRTELETSGVLST